jgi:hypothetical protein
MEKLEIKNKTFLDLVNDENKFDSSVDTIEGVNDIENQVLTLDIVCKYCGDKRASVTIRYKTMKDQGYFRAACVCERCLERGATLKT